MRNLETVAELYDGREYPFEKPYRRDLKGPF